MAQPAPLSHEVQGEVSPKIIDTYVDFLSYSDVVIRDRPEKIGDLTKSQNAQRYTGELLSMFDEYGQDKVLGEARKAVGEMRDMLNVIGVEPTQFAGSQTWFLWHAAKLRYLENNPLVRAKVENTEKYDPIDPFLHTKDGVSVDQAAKSRKARDEILYTYLGWELHPKASADPTLVTDGLDPETPPEIREEIEALADEIPEDRESLSSYKLRRFGELVWTYRRGAIADMRQSIIDAAHASTQIGLATDRVRASGVLDGHNFETDLSGEVKPSFGSGAMIERQKPYIEKFPEEFRPRIAALGTIRQMAADNGYEEVTTPKWLDTQDPASPLILTLDTITAGIVTVTFVQEPAQIVFDAHTHAAYDANDGRYVAKEITSFYEVLKRNGATINPIVMWRDGKTYTIDELPKLKTSANTGGREPGSDPRPPMGTIISFNRRKLAYIGGDAFYCPITHEIVQLTESAIAGAMPAGDYRITSLPDSPWSDILMTQSRSGSGGNTVVDRQDVRYVDSK